MLACIATLTNGKSYPLQNPKMEEGKTTPKKHFTEDSLLSAMERAGADEMPEEVERKGIGTSAPRAATIEKLVRIGFVERKGNKKTKYLLPTHKGVALITVMPEQIQSPFMTAEWEQKLRQIHERMQEAGISSLTAYMIRMALHGYVIVMDLSDLKEVLRLLQISGNNLNQYEKKANETGSIYHEDIEELRTNQKEILQEMRKVLDRLTAIM